MISTGAISGAALARSLAGRTVALLLLWIIVGGAQRADLLPGLVAGLATAGISLRLLPPGAARLRPAATAQLGLRLLQQSITAGIDVARRALDPQLPVNPGLVHYAVGLPPGPIRNTFTSLMSLLPGTVPVRADASNRLIVHCLDAGQPVAKQLALEEALLVRAAGGTSGDG